MTPARPFTDDERTYLLRCRDCDGWAWSDEPHACPVHPAARWVLPVAFLLSTMVTIAGLYAVYRWIRG